MLLPCISSPWVPMSAFAASLPPSVAALPPPAGAPDGAHAARIKPTLVMAIP
ncbi:MAG: hypothetical protein R2838_10760 [Caldilineaceae bacterium]